MKKEIITAKSAADDVLILPRKVLGVLADIGEKELKTLIYILGNKECDSETLVSELKISEEDYEAALVYLKAAGIIETASAPQQKKVNTGNSHFIQTYDSQTVAAAVESDDGFKGIVEIAGESLGKLLNKNDLNSLFYLYDYAGMDACMILTIIEYCVSMGKLSMQYIMKTALNMVDSGIDTFEKLEQYLCMKSKRNENDNRLRSLCGFGMRAYTAKEEKLVTRWFEEMMLEFDMVRLAYEITVDKTGSAKLAYMARYLRIGFQKATEPLKI